EDRRSRERVREPQRGCPDIGAGIDDDGTRAGMQDRLVGLPYPRGLWKACEVPIALAENLAKHQGVGGAAAKLYAESPDRHPVSRSTHRVRAVTQGKRRSERERIEERLAYSGEEAHVVLGRFERGACSSLQREWRSAAW